MMMTAMIMTMMIDATTDVELVETVTLPFYVSAVLFCRCTVCLLSCVFYFFLFFVSFYLFLAIMTVLFHDSCQCQNVSFRAVFNF